MGDKQNLSLEIKATINNRKTPHEPKTEEPLGFRVLHSSCQLKLQSGALYRTSKAKVKRQREKDAGESSLLLAFCLSPLAFFDPNLRES
jgi:hypothetical protein